MSTIDLKVREGMASVLAILNGARPYPRAEGTNMSNQVQQDFPPDDFVYEMIEQMQGEIARVLREMLGEEKCDPRIFTRDERRRRVEAMQNVSNITLNDAERHRAWCAQHLLNGWSWGPEFNPAKKEHPNLVPWEELPASARSKAQIFSICAKYARTLSDYSQGLTAKARHPRDAGAPEDHG